jgi:hypothetical protein
MNITELATLAIQHLRPELLVLVGKTAEGAATESGKQIISWLRDHLKSHAAETALADAAAHPDDDRRLAALKLQIEILSEENESFRNGLAALLQKLPAPTITQQKVTASGGSTVIQVAGDGNKIKS